MARADYIVDGYHYSGEEYDDYYNPDPYEDYQPAQQQDDRYRGGLIMQGWAPDGSSWTPVYRGNDGNLYTEDGTPWGGDSGSLRTGDGPGGRPNWSPGDNEPGNATQSYEESVQEYNEQYTNPQPSGGGGSSSRDYDDDYDEPIRSREPERAAWTPPAIDESYLQPWTETFAPPAGATPPTWTPPPAFSHPDWQAPAPFQPVTAEDLLKDPGYLFRESRITNGIENSAAARGLLGSSGTLYDLGSAVSNFAGQEYGAANDRAWQQWQGGFDASLTDYTTDRNNAVDTYATNYGVSRDTHNMLTAASNDIYERAWREFTDRQKTFYDNQDRPWEKLYKMSELGARAAAY